MIYLVSLACFIFYYQVWTFLCENIAPSDPFAVTIFLSSLGFARILTSVHLHANSYSVSIHLSNWLCTCFALSSSLCSSYWNIFCEQGNTAVYLQYAHARICSIIRKSNKDVEELKTVSLVFY
jgi:hypothetical protein